MPKLNSNNPDDYMERLTFFSDTEGFRSGNGVIGEDGAWMVFQGSILGRMLGLGVGFIFMI